MVNQSHFFSPHPDRAPGLDCLHRREELLRRDAPAGGLAAALAIIGVKASQSYHFRARLAQGRGGPSAADGGAAQREQPSRSHDRHAPGD